MRLLPVDLVAGDDDVEQVLDRDRVERQLDRRPALRRHDPELAAVRLQVLERSSIPSHATSSAWSGALCSV